MGMGYVGAHGSFLSLFGDELAETETRRGDRRQAIPNEVARGASRAEDARHQRLVTIDAVLEDPRGGPPRAAGQLGGMRSRLHARQYNDGVAPDENRPERTTLAPYLARH